MKQNQTTENLMTRTRKNECHGIIHSWSAAAGAGNLIPVPGTGLAVDTAALTMMAIQLAAVFGQNLGKGAAEGVALSALKKELLKKPLKAVGKELCKIVPWGGQALACTVSIAFAEAAGWSMAKDFSHQA